MARTSEFAETVGLKALGWLVSEEDLLPVFLGATGFAPQDLAGRAGEAEVLAAVLDFLMMDDAWIRAFCDAEGLGYEMPRAARAALPGAAVDDWA